MLSAHSLLVSVVNSIFALLVITFVARLIQFHRNPNNLASGLHALIKLGLIICYLLGYLTLQVVPLLTRLSTH